jgi:hypothetical protein
MKKIVLIVLILFYYNNLISQNLVPFLKSNGKYIYLNSVTLEKINNEEYDDALLFKESYAFVKKGTYWGMLNKKCEPISNFNLLLGKYGVEYATERGSSFYNDKFNFEKSVFGIFGPTNNFNEKYSVVYDNKNKTIILSNKGEIINSEYDDIKIVNATFKNSKCYIFKNNNKKGIIDTNFSVIHNKLYDNIELINNTDLFKIKEKNKYGILNDLGEESIEIKYDDIEFKENGSIFKIRNNSKFGLANYYGEFYFQPKLDYIKDIRMFNDSTFIFTYLNRDTIGLMNNFGKKVFFKIIPGLSKLIGNKDEIIDKYLSFDGLNDTLIYFQYNNYLKNKTEFNYYQITSSFKISKRVEENTIFYSGSNQNTNYDKIYIINSNGVRFNPKYIKTENKIYYDDINSVEIKNKRIGFIVKLNGKSKIIDANANDYIVNSEYQYIYLSYTDDKYIIFQCVSDNNTYDYYIYNYIINDVKLIKHYEYNIENDFTYNFIPFKLGNKYQFLDFAKNKLISESVDNYKLSSGKRFLILKNDNKYGIYDLFNIKNHLPIIYDDIIFNDKSNFILVSKNNKTYFINIINNLSFFE